MCQYIGGTKRNDAQTDAGAQQAVGDLGYGTVTAGRDDHRFPSASGFSRQRFGVTGAMRFNQIQSDAVGNKDVQHAP